MTLSKFEVALQPTEEQIKAGVNQLCEDLPGVEDDVDEEQLQDAVVFVWQAMIAAR
jgi:hypothetical protein